MERCWPVSTNPRRAVLLLRATATLLWLIFRTARSSAARVRTNSLRYRKSADHDGPSPPTFPWKLHAHEFCRRQQSTRAVPAANHPAIAGEHRMTAQPPQPTTILEHFETRSDTPSHPHEMPVTAANPRTAPGSVIREDSFGLSQPNSFDAPSGVGTDTMSSAPIAAANALARECRCSERTRPRLERRPPVAGQPWWGKDSVPPWLYVRSRRPPTRVPAVSSPPNRDRPSFAHPIGTSIPPSLKRAPTSVGGSLLFFWGPSCCGEQKLRKKW